MHSFKEIKAITIGTVSQLTGLSERQIRYYEERKLVTPERTDGGTRKYSFTDIEKMIEISQKITKGVNTYTIRQEEKHKKDELQKHAEYKYKEKMLKGQYNAMFKRGI